MTTTSPTTPRTDVPARAESVFRLTPPRAREFGVGYGASSGYASGRRYAAREWAAPRFRCA